MNQNHKKAKLLVLVATNFEDIELITVLDILKRGGVEYDLASVENKTQVAGQFNAIVNTVPLNKIDHQNYQGLFLPGGPGTNLLLESKEVSAIVKDFDKRKAISAAICAAPQVLFNQGILENRRYTSYPGMAISDANTGAEVELDGNVLTGRDFLAAPAFADALVKLVRQS